MTAREIADLRDLLRRLDDPGVQCVAALIACAAEGWTEDAQDYAAALLGALERARRRRAMEDVGKRRWR